MKVKVKMKSNPYLYPHLFRGISLSLSESLSLSLSESLSLSLSERLGLFYIDGLYCTFRYASLHWLEFSIYSFQLHQPSIQPTNYPTNLHTTNKINQSWCWTSLNIISTSIGLLSHLISYFHLSIYLSYIGKTNQRILWRFRVRTI